MKNIVIPIVVVVVVFIILLLFSNGNNTNDNNSTVPSYSLYAVTVAVALPWVRRVYCYQYCMPGATNYLLSVLYETNYVLSEGNDTNDNITSTPSSSFSAATAAAVAYPWARRVYST